jgi:cardiolipin synthase (CMP-forming)
VNLANLITLARLISVPVVIWAILAGEMGLAFALFVAAGISDAIDGFIAKRFHTESVFGSYLDPLADKALLMSVYIALGHEGYLPIWLVILVVFRDVLIIGGVLLLFTIGTKSVRVAPLLISKANTAAQIVLAAVALGGEALGMPQPMIVTILVWTIAATTVLSGAGYLVQWGRKVADMEGRQ